MVVSAPPRWRTSGQGLCPRCGESFCMEGGETSAGTGFRCGCIRCGYVWRSRTEDPARSRTADRIGGGSPGNHADAGYAGMNGHLVPDGDPLRPVRHASRRVGTPSLPRMPMRIPRPHATDGSSRYTSPDTDACSSHRNRASPCSRSYAWSGP